MVSKRIKCSHFDVTGTVVKEVLCQDILFSHVLDIVEVSLISPVIPETLSNRIVYICFAMYCLNLDYLFCS